ncbi:DNA (cytosine-5-)-methyltransferase [Lujinxingia vulgaris]|uniref:Cytosine-specific methyltransferase n=1 Tax=Lujinxingia vulgaris TaxID=2600176 RepID=A0A5C6XGD8_9DELT|nr:DNA (cytosine-5-)-methyltransferase [Lujinxingia vulgaris]TXD37959.1 DNA (cytosine-5-)-methyltransferase [Lujinxingia vulgaris]
MNAFKDKSFRFIDLFAGIGGIRIAFERQGGRCVMTSEIDKFARQTYQAYFNDEDHFFNEDITAIAPDDIPDHDMLLGGFPCQPFSLAGVSKKNSLGREHGFRDPTSGTLFFNIKSILHAKRPAGFLLENVKNLRGHDKGRTWQVIADTLDAAGYAFTDRIIDAAQVVPQHRERVFIVGFDREKLGLRNRKFDWAAFWDEVDEELRRTRERERARYYKNDIAQWPQVRAILEPESEVPDKYTLSEKLWAYLQNYKAKHEARGNGFGYGLLTGEEAYTRTISARYHKDGSEALVAQAGSPRPRRLTPRECSRLQGFPDDFEQMYIRDGSQPVSDTQAYRQFGNSVCVPVVEAIARVQVRYLSAPKLFNLLPFEERPLQQVIEGINVDDVNAVSG